MFEVISGGGRQTGVSCDLSGAIVDLQNQRAALVEKATDANVQTRAEIVEVDFGPEERI
jgi:hypothetical protein